ncbi:nucleotide-binding protein [Clostridium botulinum]|uniref:nucleotide-binding protein n=1 Tax=Clostridium botulinum TaxID=1491 RepID=UPI0022475E6C|nr:nucleotide-binding protein [Clostridium botulinum]UZP04015.1 nucleotide-binding protein [Clostridium botulinum]UZP07371.1 nucleotide-binding protein [Clostridium botulinum]UZP10753.1 nucleotide-binding protein [Clostridium botulinum]
MNQIIIQRLKKWIKPLSVNQIKTISPKLLMDELQVSDRELLEIVQFLYKERVISYRYKFKCDECGNNCIVYEKKLKFGEYNCGECGKHFELKDVVEKSKVLYEFDKDEMIKLGEDEEVDFTKATFGDNVVSFDAHKEKIEGGTMEKEKKVIFFGSSQESADVMDEIAAIVATLGFKTLTWNSASQGVFIAGDSILDNLINTTKNVDGAIFIFSDDDKTWCRDEILRSSVRDNVLFEYGLFMGYLGKTKVAFASKNKPKLASDLLGVTYISADLDEAVIRLQLKEWLKRV